MAKPITILRGSVGLNNKSDPTRLTVDPQTGSTELAAAVNVDHDRTGRISRRKGYAATAVTLNSHSLWCDGGACLFVSGTSLYELFADYRYRALATVTSGARVSYVQIGRRSYWMNGHEKGYVEAGANNSWVKGTYYGPTTTRVLSDPPIGSLLAYHGGCMYIAQADTAWYSQPYNLNAFDLARGYFQFPASIRMMVSTSDGMYLGTDKATYWLPGQNPITMEQVEVASYPPIEGTAQKIDLSKIRGGDIRGTGYLWASTEGICLGGPGGVFINLTERKLTYPTSRYGAGIVFDDRYVATLQP